MATTKASTEMEASSKALQCQRWVLKVSIHCQACKRKVKKVLQGINGVYTTSVNSQQQMVTVTGNVEVETLIKKLKKTGKHAELWPQYNHTATKDNQQAKPSLNNTNNNNDFNNKDNRSGTSTKLRREGQNGGTESGGKKFHTARVAKRVSERESCCGDGGGALSDGGKKKKKKKKTSGLEYDHLSKSGSTGSSQSNSVGMDEVVGLSDAGLTSQHQFTSPQGLYFYSVFDASSCYNSMECCPGGGREMGAGPFYYSQLQPSAYTNASSHQMTPLDSLHYFSDENVNGCFIM